jgi:hypothetical protein
MPKKSKEETVKAPRSKKSTKQEKAVESPAISSTKGKKSAPATPPEPVKPKASAAKAATAGKKKPVTAKPVASRKKAPEIHISNEDIALRAYYIAERRQKMGWPGNSADDWLEAEAQLREEARAAAKRQSLK